MKITICRRSHFNAAHKLYNKSWSKEKNLEVFGKCSYENYLDIDYFHDKIPSTENLAIYIWNRLNNAIKIDCKLTVVLYETHRNYVEYSG